MLTLVTLLAAVQIQAAAPAPADIEVMSLPALEVDGRLARAHTQGLECIGNSYYVTARQDDVAPNRALLLRTAAGGSHWDFWDITPAHAGGAPGSLDHPGGMQSDGKRLWIPVAESVRHGKTVIRVFALDRLVPGQPATSELDWPVADHIGAVAVAKDGQLVVGANWDTETVYVWDIKGHLQRTLSGAELKSRNLGSISGHEGRAGVAVQDWKMKGDRFYASGLFRDPMGDSVSPKSRLLVFTRFLEPGFECQTIRLPGRENVELGQEAMAISGGSVYFLPEDLGATNRLFRLPLAKAIPSNR